ncbi:MAG: hypothetical protein IJR72_06020 [Oscillospiraceae bacterium]|nr:hypothetical protein [Oscillospiraceae bacterium]
MRLLTRDFTTVEKLILLVLVLFLMGLGYYYFIDQPIRRGIEEAHAERDALQLKLNDINIRISDYQNMAEELRQARELRQAMPSYNQSETELHILNDILTVSDKYALAFDKITLERNQIRRGFQFSFTAPDFETAKGIFTRLSASRVRCLIGDVECSGVDKESGRIVSFKANGTFYETKVDAVLDAVLAELIQQQEQQAAAAAKTANR